MKAPWLVQRAKFKNASAGSIDDVLSFDYMGSAEFEFGALPKSLKRITKNLDRYKLEEVSAMTSGVDGKQLYILIPERLSLIEYTSHLFSMANGTLRMKESSNFDDAIKGVDFHGKSITENSWNRCDVWWDIENDTMWSFGEKEIDKVINSLQETRDKKKAEKAEGWY